MNWRGTQVPGLNSELLNSEPPEDSDFHKATDAGFVFPPGVFLMTDSFQTGGSERQFVELARALDPLAYRISLGCLQVEGAFAEGSGSGRAFRPRWQLVPVAVNANAIQFSGLPSTV